MPPADQAPSEERRAFKDYFDRAAARSLGAQVGGTYRKLDQKKFVRLATKNLADLEFAARVQQFADALRTTLPESIPKALDVLVRSLPAPLPDCESVTDGWLQWPVGQFVADHGLDHFDESMTAMTELTQRFSSEFAVRPFVEHRADETFAHLRTLTQHESPHVRRWCSEGIRPRLPWGKKLTALVADPKPILPILEALKDDEEVYVRRSVANNLNDIAKDHPKLVIERCRAWSKRSNERRDWVIKHALRSLVKAGDPAALELVGFGAPRGLRARLRVTPKTVAIGGDVELVATLETTAAKAQELLVDYVVHYVRKGAKSSGKVFKWKTLALSARGKETLRKRHRMHTTTIRALYPGRHRVELQINGVRVGESSFRLET